MFSRLAHHPVARALLWLAALILFGYCLIQSVHVAVDWWHGRFPVPGLRQWFWLLLLPILIVIYLRYFSVLNPDCQACQVPEMPQDDPRHK